VLSVITCAEVIKQSKKAYKAEVICARAVKREWTVACGRDMSVVVGGQYLFFAGP